MRSPISFMKFVPIKIKVSHNLFCSTQVDTSHLVPNEIHVTVRAGHAGERTLPFMELQDRKNQIMSRSVCSRYNNCVILQFKKQYYLSLLVDKNFYTVGTGHGSPSALNRCMLLQKGLFHRLVAMWARHGGKLTMCQMTLGKEKP